tara:strand:- start:311 stop:577 length:267 start_codon:yes stop_codon:yes gene_type:complete
MMATSAINAKGSTISNPAPRSLALTLTLTLNKVAAAKTGPANEVVAAAEVMLAEAVATMLDGPGVRFESMRKKDPFFQRGIYSCYRSD